MTGDDGWMLPSIADDIEVVNSALDMVKLSLTQRRPAGEPHSPLKREELPSDDSDALVVELANVTVALSNLSAVLLLYLQARSKRPGPAVDGLALLETMRMHEQTRADLASLDERPPFDG